MTRLVLPGALILIAVGCNSRQEPLEGVKTVETVETVEAVEAVAPDTESPADRPPAPEKAAEAQAPTEAEAPEPDAPTPPKPERDLGSELRAAVGSLADCLEDYRPSSPMTIRVNIRAVVRPTGMIIEPSASGRGLSVNDRRCVEQRVGAVTLAPIEAQASETVSTYIDVQYEPPTVETFEVGRPPPKPDDVVEPLPKKKPIAPSGVPIEGPAADPIEGPSGDPIEGPEGVPIEGPKPVPIRQD